MTFTAIDLGALGVSVALVLALGVGYYWNSRAVALLLDRVSKMIPTTIAYLSLFAVAATVEIVGESVAVRPAALFAGGSAVVLSWCGSWFMNDVYDKESDQESDEQRATADGRLTDRQTLAAALLLWAGSLAFAALLNAVAVVATAGMILLNVVYSVPPVRLKASGLGSMVSIGLMGATAVFLGSASVVADPTRTVWKLAGVVTVFMVLNLSYKDLKDADEDAKSGVENFVVSFGKRNVQLFLVVCLPLSYLIGAFAIGVTTVPTLTLVGLVGLLAVGVLLSHDISTAALAYRLDVVNSVYLFCLAGSYYLLYG